MADSLRRVSELVWHAGSEHSSTQQFGTTATRGQESGLFHASLWIWATSCRNSDSFSGISSLSPYGCEATDPASELDLIQSASSQCWERCLVANAVFESCKLW
eukprot:8409796-Pyramimonas_sp.AAC.1